MTMNQPVGILSIFGGALGDILYNDDIAIDI